MITVVLVPVVVVVLVVGVVCVSSRGSDDDCSTISRSSNLKW